METKTVKVPSISCGHCVHTIKMELLDMQGVSSAEADVATKELTVTFGDPATWEDIRGLLDEIGYPVAE